MICALCGNKSKSGICAKCDDRLYGKKKQKRQVNPPYTDKVFTGLAKRRKDIILKLLSKNKKHYFSIGEIRELTGLNQTDIRIVLLSSLRNLTKEGSGDFTDHFKLKESLNDVDITVSAILDGSSVTDEIERLLDVVH
jgi:hypothetical protein